MEIKICKVCGSALLESNWVPSCKRTGWRICRSCLNKKVQLYRRNNREKCLSNQRRHYSLHRDRLLAEKKEYTKRTKEVRRIRSIRRLYGISPEEYDKLYVEQNGRCAICREKETHIRHGSVSLCIDHDHKIGKVRGLLCNKCNRTIGLFKDNILLLQKAIEYLNKESNNATGLSSRQ